ncbi:MAG: uroporphyrinogen-III synthase [Candidatus Omnitrophica bacterium]|nr:uroporphyrinogen-III synthase [Candidatus Omnitrophota bacterium]
MRAMIVRHGGTPLIAPALREVPLAEHHEALAFADRLLAGEVDMLICLTGVGTRTLAAAIATRHPLERLREALHRITVVARGPKPIKALTELGVTRYLAVPEPNTWHELLATLDAQAPVRGQRVAVQEYGASNPELLEALRARGAEVLVVPVYRWALPDDPGPLRRAARAIADGRVEVALFTNATQVEHLHRIAVEEQVAEAMARARPRMVIGSIGPIASDALRRLGWPVDVEPSHPKMGILVQETAARAAGLLQHKGRG